LKSNKINFTIFILILIIIIGSGLRLYGLDRSLWLDEVLSVASQSEFQRHLSNIYLPMHLYFVVLHLFTFLGTSEIVLRLPSLIFGILSILLMYKIGKLFFGRTEGLIGAFLLSISTMLIEHSQEARYYSLSTFLSLLSFFFLFKVVKEKDRKLWLGFIFATILAVLSHYYMIFVALIQVIFLSIIVLKKPKSFIMSVKKIGKTKIFFIFLGLLLIIAFSFPIIQNILDQFLSGSGYAGQATFGIPPESFFQDLFSSFSFGHSFSYFSFLSGDFGAIISISIFFFFLLLGLITSAKKYPNQTILLLLWIFLPAILIFFLSVSLNSALIDAKYLIFIVPGYLLCISKGISSISSILLKYYYKFIYGLSSIPLLEKRRLIIEYSIIIIILGVFVGATIIPLEEHYSSPGEDWRNAAEFLETNSKLGDAIIIKPSYLEQCLLYYYEQNPNTVAFMKNITTSQDNTMRPFRDFLELVSESNRVWIVRSPRHMQDYNPNILNWTQYNTIKASSFAGISVYLHPSGLIQINSKDMNFSGLDSSPDDPVALFFHDGDSASFTIDISSEGYYSMAIHAKPWINSAVEILIDGESKSIKTFHGTEWENVDLGASFLNRGIHEIQIISREGGDFGHTDLGFDQFIIWPHL
jgi:4-amino-4-deoxy-L-arabinose transferase-like glycosyltransferase